MGFILAFTNSASRTVIDSTVASPLQLGRGQLQAEASAHTPSPRRGFCSFILAADALALALGVHQAPCKAFASLTRIAYPHSLGAALALFAISGVEKFKNVMAVTDFLALFWQ